ncbi:MAG TPA: hypothetical protein VFR01_05220 [Geobacterales bacterium]|nr:hypothetical protein [Geobacterales bacterium]
MNPPSRQLHLFLFLFLFLSIPLSAQCGRVAHRSSDQQEIAQSFVEVIQLWHDGRLDELYERTWGESSQGRDEFAKRLDKATCRPACCWQMVNNVTVASHTNRNATVQATLGLDRVGTVSYRTGEFHLRQGGGRWRLSRTELLRLAESHRH